MAWNAIPKQPPQMRHDGYVNMLNRYGTAQDSSTQYKYYGDGMVPDMDLTAQYENNGLFAKIVDTPAEEAVKHGFDLGINNQDIQTYIDDMLDALDWEEKASQAIKWSRLYGGAIGVMLIDDGRGIDEPVDYDNIKGIEEIRIYEQAIAFPDYRSMYNYDPANPTRSATTKFGVPEHYEVDSMFGQFYVHESRCLIFRNGILPEKTLNPYYRFWGIPEYVRIKKELQQAITSHSTGVKMLERSVQAIYQMKDLASLLATDEGMDIVIKRLTAIDMARGILNSIAIDSEGENYDFKTIPMSGVRDVIDTTCNMLSAVTNIPQTVLFGRSPAGQNSTGKSDMKNYYNYVEGIQKLMLKSNLRTLLDIIVRAGLSKDKITEEPTIKIKFNPLWSMSEAEQAEIGRENAQSEHLKAMTASKYIENGVLLPSEVRDGLAENDDFVVEEILDDSDDYGTAYLDPPEPAQPILGHDSRADGATRTLQSTQELKELVKPKFYGQNNLNTKYDAHYPKQVEDAHERIASDYMDLLNKAINRHIPKMRYVRLDAMQMQPISRRTINRIRRDFERSARTFGLEDKIRRIARRSLAFTTSEWKKAVGETLSVDLMQDYYMGGFFANQLDRWVNRNIRLIKSVPQTQLTNMDAILREGYLLGKLTREIAKELKQSFGIEKRKVQFWARDQLSKLNGQVTAAQQRDAGITEYV